MATPKTAKPRRKRARRVAPFGPREVQMMAVSALKPHPRNARTHSARQASLLRELVERFGYFAPLLATVGGIVAAGHLRLLVATALGLRTVPVIVLGPLSDSEIETLMLADN